MRDPRPGRWTLPTIASALAAVVLGLPGSAFASGKAAWLDDVLRKVVREAEFEGRAVARTSERSASRVAGRLLARDADEGLEAFAKGSDDLARAAGKLDEPAEAALKTRFGRLVRSEPEMAREFAALAPAEKRLVVEMGETARRLAVRYPGKAEPMIKSLGSEGMSAVRVYGDDVAEVLVKEGPESVGVLRKSGRGGWKFYTEQVLAHKKKLAAAGVLGLFLADPDKFVDVTGRATQYAVDQFARAGIQLAGAIGGGAARGLDSAIGRLLASYGINSEIARKAGMGLAGLVALLAAMTLLGMPIRWMFRPILWPLRLLRRPTRPDPLRSGISH